MSFHYPTITIFACKAGYRSNELVNFRELPDGSAVAVIPTGQKFTYSAQELDDFARVMIAQAGRGESQTRLLETKNLTSTRPSVTKKMETEGRRRPAKSVPKNKGPKK